MIEKLIIHCDKCDSTNVLHEQVMAKPTEVHKTMSDVVNSAREPLFVGEVHYYTRYNMICKDCWHIVEYMK